MRKNIFDAVMDYLDKETCELCGEQANGVVCDYANEDDAPGYVSYGACCSDCYIPNSETLEFISDEMIMDVVGLESAKAVLS
jgi:hypothetical protein